MYLILSFYLSFSRLFRNVSYSKQHCSAIQEPVCGNLYFPWMKIMLMLLVLPSSPLSLLSALHPCSWPDLHCGGKAGSFCPLSFHDSYKYSLLTNAPVTMLEDRGNRLRNHTVLNGRRKVPKKKKIMEKSYRDMPDCVYWSSHYKFHFCFGSCDSVLFGDAAKIQYPINNITRSQTLDTRNSTDSALPHPRFQCHNHCNGNISQFLSFEQWYFRSFLIS